MRDKHQDSPGQARGECPGLQQQRGSALIVALFALLVITTIGLALAFNGMTEVRISRNYQTGMEASYIAEAGLDHALEVIQGNSLDFAAVLQGGDGVSGTADDGLLTLGAIPAADRIPGEGVNYGTGNYQVLVTDGSGGAQSTLIVTATGTSTNGSHAAIEARITRNGSGSAAAGYSGSAALDGSLFIGGSSVSSASVFGTGGINCNVVTLTNLDLTGTGDIYGNAYSLGTSTNISLGGSSLISGNAVATGSITGQGYVEGTRAEHCTTNRPTVPTVPQVNPEDYRYDKIQGRSTGSYDYYTLKRDGTVFCDSCRGGTVASTGGTWNGWSRSGNTWSLSNHGNLEATFFVEGDADIGNNHSGPFHMTIIATGYIDIATNNDLAPSWANCALVAGTDIHLSGNSSVTSGWMGAHEQVSLNGGTGMLAGAPIIVENAASDSSLVTTISLGGNASMTCSGGAASSSGLFMPASGQGLGSLQRISWREIRN